MGWLQWMLVVHTNPPMQCLLACVAYVWCVRVRTRKRREPGGRARQRGGHGGGGQRKDPRGHAEEGMSRLDDGKPLRVIRERLLRLRCLHVDNLDAYRRRIPPAQLMNSKPYVGQAWLPLPDLILHPPARPYLGHPLCHPSECEQTWRHWRMRPALSRTLSRARKRVARGSVVLREGIPLRDGAIAAASPWRGRIAANLTCRCDAKWNWGPRRASMRARNGLPRASRLT